MDNFSDTPKTIGEVRSDKTGTAHDWLPRDLLISTLRDIDKNNLEIEAAIFIWIEKGEISPRFRISSKSPTITYGMLQYVINNCLITE